MNLSEQLPKSLSIHIRTPEKQIEYTCARNAWQEAAAFVAERFPKHSIVIVTDANIHALYGAAITEAFSDHQHFMAGNVLTVPAGEASKSRAEKDRLEDELFERKCGRDTVLVAVGGGVVGDLAGYVAATFNRGVPLVHVPTTLLAQVDSSIGGKTGINHAAGKNLIGAFYQPEAIVASVRVLATLPETEFRSGMAEVLKYAATLDAELWELLECHAELVNARDEELLQKIILRSAAIKIRVVEEDEKESGLRAILNFGHTVGHAFEALGKYEIPHGFCVAAGMRVALRLSRTLLGYPDDYVARFDALLGQYGLNLDYTRRFQHEDIWEATIADKKSRGGAPCFVLMRSPTEYVLAHPVEKAALFAALSERYGSENYDG